MVSENYGSKVRGAILGAALGDATRAPFEFRSKRWVIDTTGEDWTDGLYHSQLGRDPHGVWEKHTAPGTETDDVRLNWVLLNLASDLGRVPTWRELGDRFAQVGNSPATFFPSHTDLAKGQFVRWESCVAEATSFNPDSRGGSACWSDQSCASLPSRSARASDREQQKDQRYRSGRYHPAISAKVRMSRRPGCQQLGPSLIMV